MESEPPAPSIWGRAAGDPEFREALIDDPLRALAAVGDTSVSAEQVQQLDAMDSEERREVVTEVIRRVTLGHVRDRWGDRFWTPDEPGPTPGDAGG